MEHIEWKHVSSETNMFIANSFHDECRYSSNKLRVIILDYSFNALQRWIVNKKSTLMYNLRNNCFQNKRNVVLLDNFCVGTRLLLISIERFISLCQSCHIEYHNILDEDISRGNQMKWLSFKWQKISICVQIFDFFTLLFRFGVLNCLLSKHGSDGILIVLFFKMVLLYVCVESCYY